MPLIIQVESHVDNADNRGIIQLKKSCFTSFWSLWPDKCNGAMENIGITKLCLDIV